MPIHVVASTRSCIPTIDRLVLHCVVMSRVGHQSRDAGLVLMPRMVKTVWAYDHEGLGTCRLPCPMHGRCHCGCGEGTRSSNISDPCRHRLKGAPFVFRRGHRARVFVQGGGAWTSQGIDVGEIRPLLEWLRSRHGSVRAVSRLLNMPESTVRGYMYKRGLKRVPAHSAQAIVALVLAHRSAPRLDLGGQWEVDELTRWKSARETRMPGYPSTGN